MEDPLSSPSELLCCRGCLSTVNLCGIHDRRLAETFERVTGHPVLPQDGLPQHLCGTCCSLLAKSAAFRERCRRAQHCLLTRGQRDLTMDHIKTINRLSHGLVFSLVLTQVQIIDLGNSTQNEIKYEPYNSDSRSSIYEPENEIIDTFSSGVKGEFNDLDVDDISETCTDGYVTVEVDQTIDTIVKVDKAIKPTVKVEVKKPIENKEDKVRITIVKQKKIPDITYRGLKSLRGDTPIDNDLESSTGFGECEEDEDMQTVDDDNIAEVKKKVKKKQKPRKIIPNLIKDIEEFKKDRKLKKKIAGQNKEKKKLQDIPQIESGCLSTDHLLSKTIVKQNKKPKEQMIPEITYCRLKSDNLLKSQRDDTPKDNDLESSIDFGDCEIDVNMETIDDDIAEVKKKPRKSVLTLIKEFKEFKKERKLKKKIAEQNKKKKKLQNIPKIESGCPTTDKLLTSLRNDKPIFDFAKFENAFNVDITVLTREQQLADWELCKKVKKEPAAFYCNECGKGFRQRSTFTSHLLQHDPSVGSHACSVCHVRFAVKKKCRMHQWKHALQFKCRACGFVCRDRHRAKVHFNKHVGVQFKCKHCDKSFRNSSTFFRHLRAAHAAQSVACGECGDPFVSRHGLAMHHAAVHKQQKTASKCACAECGAHFDDAPALDTHRRAAGDGGCDTTLRPCAVCGESLPTEDALQRHVEEIHTKRYKCTQCPQTFSRAAWRDIHARKAHEPPPKRAPAPKSTLCEICGRQCKTPVLLKAHRRTHTGEKPFPCADCDQWFVSKANVKRHRKLIHLGHRPQVKCEECGKMVFAASLYVHVRGVHRKIRPIRRKRDSSTDK